MSEKSNGSLGRKRDEFGQINGGPFADDATREMDLLKSEAIILRGTGRENREKDEGAPSFEETMKLALMTPSSSTPRDRRRRMPSHRRLQIEPGDQTRAKGT